MVGESKVSLVNFLPFLTFIDPGFSWGGMVSRMKQVGLIRAASSFSFHVYCMVGEGDLTVNLSKK